MYSEFIEGTGCRDNEHNRTVFNRLEVMYMNTDMTKDEIYEYGKKLVDNSKSPEQIAFEKEMNERIVAAKEMYRTRRADAKVYKAYYREDHDPYWKQKAKDAEDDAKRYRREVAELKWVLQ